MSAGAPGHDEVIVGEVHTGLLQHSTSLPPTVCERALSALRGERVRSFERPIGYVVSPDLLTGVDCRLAVATGTSPRGVGSVITHTAITDGRVVQASAVGRLVPSAAGRRLPWGHYLARPGLIEVIGKGDADALARGFVAGPASLSTMDLGAIGARALDAVQSGEPLDRMPPFRVPRTKLRWAATVRPASAAPSLSFLVERGQLRTALLRCDPGQLSTIAEFCEDLALHDWLLTTLLGLVQRSRIGAGDRLDVLRRLGPAVDHLLHLWMPGARYDRSAVPFWDHLERRPGLTRQWNATVDRIRDQLALSTISLLTAAGRGVPG